MTGVNPFNFSWNLGGLTWNAWGEPNAVGIDDAPPSTTPSPPPPPPQATDTVTIGSNFTFDLGSYQPPPGWNIDEYMNRPLPIESEAIFVEIDLQDPSFWLSDSDKFPNPDEFLEAWGPRLTEEQKIFVDFANYNNSLAKALGVPWPKYQMEVESARAEFLNSIVQSHHQGGSYFFSLEPSARVTSQNANPIIERYENRQAANNLNQQLNDLRKSSKEDFLKLVKELEANGYSVQGHKVGGAYDRNPNDSVTEVYQRVYYTLNGRVLPGIGNADRLYPSGAGDGFQLVGRAGGYANSAAGNAARRDPADPATWLMSPSEQPGNTNLSVMNDGVRFKGRAVVAQIDSLRSVIDAAASAYEVDANLVKAIIFEEQTKQLPFESKAEAFGFGATVGLGQITEGYYGLSREQLRNPTIAVNAIARHLSSLTSAGSKPLPDPNQIIASIASRYNNGPTTQVTNYGRRVAIYHSLFGQRN